MTKIELRGSFLDVDPKLDIQARGIERVGIDVENLLTDYGDPDVLPGMAEHLEELTDVASIMLITNQRDGSFLKNVVRQLPSAVPYIHPTETNGHRAKPSKDMFVFMRDFYRPLNSSSDGSDFAHIDDQFKAYFGARGAQFGTFFWTEPVGEHDHPTVAKFRRVERGIRKVVTMVHGAGNIKEREVTRSLF